MTQSHPFENLYTEELYKIKSKVLIVTQKPWDQIDEAERTLLGKILGAVKHSLSMVQIINRGEFDVEDIKVFQPSCVISFGASLKNSSKMYENVGSSDVPIVVAHELHQLDDIRKKNLWLALKPLFHS